MRFAGLEAAHERGMGRWRCLRALALVLVVGCTASHDDDPASRDACERLRSHIIDVRLAGMTEVDVAAHRAAFESSLGDAFIESCGRALTVRQARCALEASDADGIE